MTDDSSDVVTLLDTLKRPERLCTRAEILQRPSSVPPVPGVYGWHFTSALRPDLGAGRLLYVGIAPRHVDGRTSSQNLRKRLRNHYRGNASSSTLRLTLGCLLGLELRRMGSGRLTFGTAGEDCLSEWMHEHARVCWFPIAQPWLVETVAIERLDLPLNLDQNRHHPFHYQLTQLRAAARARARAQPVLHA